MMSCMVNRGLPELNPRKWVVEGHRKPNKRVACCRFKIQLSRDVSFQLVPSYRKHVATATWEYKA